MSVSSVPPQQNFVFETKRKYFQRDFRGFLEGLDELASQGNSAAADVYADLLMTGLWDTHQMEIDYIRGHLQPPTKGQDPYLVLARDPRQALRYYYSAFYSKQDHVAAKIRAYSKILYCRKMGYAGYSVNQVDEDLLSAGERFLKINNVKRLRIKKRIKKFLDENASGLDGPKDEESRAAFIPHPNIRPIIQNFSSNMFKDFGKTLRNRCLIEIFIAQSVALIAFSYSYWTNVVLLSLCVCAAFSVPLAFFAYVYHFYGYKKALPICNCEKIRNAYDLATRNMPQDCKPLRSPFDAAPKFVLFAQLAKNMIFWVYTIVFTFRVIQIGINLRGEIDWLGGLSQDDPKGVIFFSVPIHFLLLALIFVSWDKKLSFSNVWSHENQNDSSLVILNVLVTLFVSILAYDRDCDHAAEKMKDKNGIARLLENF